MCNLITELNAKYEKHPLTLNIDTLFNIERNVDNLIDAITDAYHNTIKHMSSNLIFNCFLVYEAQTLDGHNKQQVIIENGQTRSVHSCRVKTVSNVLSEIEKTRVTVEFNSIENIIHPYIDDNFKKQMLIYLIDRLWRAYDNISSLPGFLGSNIIPFLIMQ